MSTRTQTNESKRTSLFGEVLDNRDFRLLWIGEGVSVLGDHFYMITTQTLPQPEASLRCVELKTGKEV